MVKKTWTKASDWIPLSNAKAAVKFWEMDLKLAEDYLNKMKKYSTYGFKFYSKMLDIALNDIEISKAGLEIAKIKLKESENLE